MPKRECFTYCPHITVCTEALIKETQKPYPSDRELVAREIDALTTAVARVAVMACEAPEVVTKTVQKNGYGESKKLVERDVYRCGGDDYTQDAAFYYQEDKMPPQ